jgi:hypothetical protein
MDHEMNTSSKKYGIGTHLPYNNRLNYTKRGTHVHEQRPQGMQIRMYALEQADAKEGRA